MSRRVDTKTAAARLRCTPRNVLHLISRGELRATRSSDGWHVDVDSLEELAGPELDLGQLDALMREIKGVASVPSMLASIFERLGEIQDEQRALNARIEALTEGSRKSLPSHASESKRTTRRRMPTE